MLTNIVGASIGRTAIYDRETLANINQALAYKFLEEGEKIPEGDKVGRQKCEDFKLK